MTALGLFGTPVGLLWTPLGPLGTPLGLLGIALGPLGTPLGPLGTALGSLGTTLGSFGNPLGRLGPLGGRLGPLWGRSGPSGATRCMALIIKGQLMATAPIFWPIGSKGHKTSWGMLPIWYLHAKFEQNHSINGQDTFKGCSGLFFAVYGKGHETN